MSAPADMPRTPPAPPPGLALTQGPFPTPTGLGPPASFDSVRLDPGRFDISGWAGDGSRVPDPARANEDVVPTIIDEARTLVGRYRRASWRAESIAEPARRRFAACARLRRARLTPPSITAICTRARFGPRRTDARHLRRSKRCLTPWRRLSAPASPLSACCACDRLRSRKAIIRPAAIPAHRQVPRVSTSRYSADAAR